MARKIFKRFTIDRHQLLSSGKLSSLGERIHDPNLWHLNRHSVARGFLAGFIAGFVFLICPFQMVIAAFIAVWIRANLPIAVSLVWITNPLTTPPIMYFCLKIGMQIYPVEHMADLKALLDFEWSMTGLQAQLAAFGQLLGEVWQPLMIGTVLLGTVLALSSYLTIQIFWRWHVRREWNARQLRRQRSASH